MFRIETITGPLSVQWSEGLCLPFQKGLCNWLYEKCFFSRPIALWLKTFARRCQNISPWNPPRKIPMHLQLSCPLQLHTFPSLISSVLTGIWAALSLHLWWSRSEWSSCQAQMKNPGWAQEMLKTESWHWRKKILMFFVGEFSFSLFIPLLWRWNNLSTHEALLY